MTLATKEPVQRRSAARSQRKDLPHPSAPSPSRPASKKRTLAICIFLVLATVAVYSSVGKNPFVDYDDQMYVTDNPHVQSGLTWDTFVWALTATEASNWHPVTWLSHALDYDLFGANAGGHHWTSVLIHVLNVLLLFLLLQAVTGATWESAIVAALFALHPLNVESVSWVAERKNVLSTFFFLLALVAYGWYARRPAVARYLVLVVLFVLALASKPMVVTLPFVLLLLDVWPLQRVSGWSQAPESSAVPQFSVSRLILEKVPLLAFSAASAIMTIVAQHESVVTDRALPFSVRVEAALYAYGMYLWKMIWPVQLSVLYPHPGRSLDLWKPFVAVAVLLAVSAVAWKQRDRGPYLAVGWLWFLGTAIPIIGLLQVGVQVIADRYAYVPLIGLFVAVVWSVSSLSKRSDASLRVAAAAACVILATLAVVSWRQVRVWRSTETLWTHALQVTGNNSIAENSLANTLFKLGRYQDGMSHLRVYAALEPLDPIAHIRVGADYQDHNQLPEAAKQYETALRGSAVLAKNGASGLDSGTMAVTYMNLAVIYAQQGDSAKATEMTRRAIAIDQQAVVQMVQGLAQAVRSQPSVAGYMRLGLLLQQVGHGDEAQSAFVQARLMALSPEAHTGPQQPQ